MKIENIDFAEAVEKLAGWAGLQMPESSYGENERSKRRRGQEASSMKSSRAKREKKRGTIFSEEVFHPLP